MAADVQALLAPARLMLQFLHLTDLHLVPPGETLYGP
jgi:hypothetical protein